MTLASLKKKQRGVIVDFLDERVASRLMSMGVLPGSVVTMIRKIPMNGAIYFKINGANIALRVKEAGSVSLNLQ